MRTLSKIVVTCGTVLAAVTVSSCGDDKTDATGTVTTALGLGTTSAVAAPSRECTAADITVVGGFGDAPTITLPTDCAPPKALIVKDISEGTGPAAKTGAKLQMNYTLITWSDKNKLDSSFDRGDTFPLTLGSGQVIPGWEKGLEGIKQGSRRLLIVPPDLGYGAGGNGVAPNETLVFVTDAVKVTNA